MTDRGKDFAELKENIESVQAQIIALEQRLVVTEQSIAQIEDAIEALSVDPWPKMLVPAEHVHRSPIH